MIVCICIYVNLDILRWENINILYTRTIYTVLRSRMYEYVYNIDINQITIIVIVIRIIHSFMHIFISVFVTFDTDWIKLMTKIFTISL